MKCKTAWTCRSLFSMLIYFCNAVKKTLKERENVLSFEPIKPLCKKFNVSNVTKNEKQKKKGCSGFK